MTREESVRAVLFDADGVTQYNPEGWDEQLRAFVGGDRGEAFARDLLDAEGPALQGERRFADVLDDVARRWHVEDRRGDLLRHWRRITVSAETVQIIQALRRQGVHCYLASNQHAYRATYMRTSLGYDAIFDDQFYSCDLGVLKSSPRFFDVLLHALALPPDEVLFVDDKAEYTGIARNCGMRTEQWSVTEGVASLRERLAGHGLMT